MSSEGRPKRREIFFLKREVAEIKNAYLLICTSGCTVGTTLLSCFVIWLKSAFNKMIVGLFLVARLADHYYPQNVLINDVVFDRVCVCGCEVDV